MKKITLLCSMLTAFTYSYAQTYDLMQLTDSEFENGGGQYWSFEKLTYSSGEYSKFSKYSDKSLATFLHPWDPERFMGELIEDHSTWDSSLALNNYQWYKNRGFAWCDVERQDPEIQNIDELLLQESWSYITRDFEFIPTIGWTPVISFKVPQDGYYLFKGEIVRIDGSYNDATALFAKARYRSSGTDKVAVIGGLISEKYGKEGKEVDGFAWDPGRLNQHYTIQEPTSISFAFNAKKGDIISFEGDCSHLPYNTDSWGRSMNSKSKWLKLNLQVIDEATAKANETFVDPTYDEYYDKLILLSDEVLSIVGESSYGDGFNEYPEKSGEELMAVYNIIVEADLNKLLNNSTSYAYIELLNMAKETFLSSLNKVDINATGNYVLFPSGSSDISNIFNKTEESVWDFGSYTNATGDYKVYGDGVGTFGTSGKYGSTANHWYEGTNDWFYIATDGNIHPLTSKQPVIFFTAPEDGIYRATGEIVRPNPNASVENPLYSRFRFLSEGSLNCAVSESMGFDKMYGSVASGKATEPVESSFFVNLKKGDKITFEMDAYTSNRNSSAGSVWNKVYVLTTADGEKPFSEQDAVNSGLYYNPYKSGDFTNLKSLLEEVNLFIKMSDFGDELGKYSVSVKQSVDDYILNIVNDLIEDDNVNQKQVDECYNTLNNLFAELKSSGHFTIVTDNIDDVYRFQSGYYFIRLTGSDLYITTPNEYGENNIRNSVSLQPLDVLYNDGKTGQVWNVQYNTEYTEPARYTLVSETYNSGVWNDESSTAGHINEKCEFLSGGTFEAQSNTNSNEIWRNHSIYFNGTNYAIQNVKNQTSMVLSATKDAEDNYITTKELASGIKYAWDFIPYEELLTTIAEEKINNNLFNTTNEGLVTMTNIEDLKIYSSNGTLLISLNNQVKGQLIKLDKGFYIVKAVGDDIENSYVIIIR